MTTKTASDKVLDIVGNDRQDLIDLCLKLGNLPDLAGHERPVAEAVVEWFHSAGIDARLQSISDESANAIGVLPGTGDRAGGGRSLILNAHMDTEGGLPAGGPEERRRLRGTWQEGDMLIGKGLVNDKAQLCAQMIAARAIKKAGITLKGDLIVTGVAQETGSPVDDASPWSVRDPMAGPHTREGYGTRWLIDRGVVADYALVGEAEGSDFGLDTAQAGYVRLRIAVRGRMPYTPFIHRGPTLADNPNPHEKAAHVVVALEEWAKRYQEKETLEYWGGTIIPTAQVHEIRSSGVPFTEVDDYCYVYVDIRTVPGRSPLDIRHEIQDLVDGLGIDCEVTPYDYNRGYIAENAEPLIEAVRSAHLRVLGSELQPPAPPFVSMWRDMNAFNEAGIPSLSYGPPARSEPYTMEGYRGVLTADLVEVAKVFALTAVTICGVADQ